MPDQARVGPHLERAEATFLFGAPEPLLNMMTRERGNHKLLEWHAGRRVAHEVLDLVRAKVARHDQPVGAIGWV